MEKVLVLAAQKYSFKGDTGNVDIRKLIVTDGVPQVSDREQGVQVNELPAEEGAMAGLRAVPGVYHVVYGHKRKGRDTVAYAAALSFVGPVALSGVIEEAA